MYLHNNQTEPEITASKVVQQIQDIQKSNDKRLVNLATIYLQDVCKANENL